MESQAKKDFILLHLFDSDKEIDDEACFLLKQFFSSNYQKVLRCRQKHMVQNLAFMMLEVYFLRILLRPNFEKLIFDDKLEKDGSFPALFYNTFFKKLSGTYVNTPINTSYFDLFTEESRNNYLSYSLNSSQSNLSEQ